MHTKYRLASQSDYWKYTVLWPAIALAFLVFGQQALDYANARLKDHYYRQFQLIYLDPLADQVSTMQSEHQETARQLQETEAALESLKLSNEKPVKSQP